MQKQAGILLYWHNMFEDTWLDNEDQTFIIWKLPIAIKHLLPNPAKYFKKHSKSEKGESKTTGCTSPFASSHEEHPSVLD